MQQLLAQVGKGDFRALARAISYVENDAAGLTSLLSALPIPETPVIGVTGPPGVGKSTLVNALIAHYISEQKKIAVLCVDPSSSLHYGALLGDRIRMGGWYQHPVFIRSLSSRGTLGGLNPKILEIVDLVKYAVFDVIIIETVGVGQNEIEIAGLADTTLVVLAPESGDYVQSMKAGLLEIADIFIVNKGDRPDADLFINHLRSAQTLTTHGKHASIPIVKTVASLAQGIPELADLITDSLRSEKSKNKKFDLLANRAFFLIQYEKMKGITRELLAKRIESASQNGHFNLYRFVQEWN